MTKQIDDTVENLLATGAHVYVVGGSIRDMLLGLPVQDVDYCVVKSDVDTMLGLGFRQVGADFPVFLHPKTGDEFALARTERKVGHGYQGFDVYADPSVTIEQDLGRRDLTMNAMAMRLRGDSEAMDLMDPYGAANDVRCRVMRHVNPVSFVEDPVRVLRIGRFMARFSDFTVAPETMELCQDMVKTGMLDELVGERIWKEVSRGLMEAKPSRMFEFLRECGALERIAPELSNLWGIPQAPQHHPEIDTGVHTMMVTDMAASRNASLLVRFAALLHDLGKGVTPVENHPSHHDHETLGLPLVKTLCERWKAPADMRKFALLVCEEHQRVHRALVARPGSIVKLFMRAGAFNRPDTLESLIEACECDARGRLGLEDRLYPQAAFLREAFTAAQAVNAGGIALSCKKPEHIPERIYAARARAVENASSHDRHAERVTREGHVKPA